MSWLTSRIVNTAPRSLIRMASVLKSQRPRFTSWRRMRNVAGPIMDALEVHPRAMTELSTLAARSDVSIVRLSTPATAASSIVKVAWNDRAARQIEREAAQLAALGADERLTSWKPARPDVLAMGMSGGACWAAQTFLAGSPTDLDAPVADTLRAGLAAIAPLHASTATPLGHADRHDFLLRIVDQPFATIATVFPQLSGPLQAAATHCRRRLEGASLVTGRIHGDVAPANLLWDQDEHTVVGIVDWELTQSDLPAEIDTVHFALSYSSERERIEYGQLVASCLRDDWHTLHPDAITTIHDTPNSWDPDIAVLVAWAHHIAGNLVKAHRYRTNTFWRDANVLPVTDAINDLIVSGRFEG